MQFISIYKSVDSVINSDGGDGGGGGGICAARWSRCRHTAHLSRGPPAEVDIVPRSLTQGYHILIDVVTNSKDPDL